MDASDIISDIIKREGSTYTDTPGDHGGPTKYGITIATMQQIHPQATVADLQVLTEQQARDIYAALYVNPFIPYTSGNQEFLALVVDSAVQHGVSRVQGWITIDLCNTYAKLLSRRIVFYGSIVQNDPTQSKFIKGWLIRVTAFVR